MSRDDLGSNTERDAGLHEWAHRPDPDHPTAADLAAQPEDAPLNRQHADELKAAIVELQRRIVAREIGWHEDGAA